MLQLNMIDPMCDSASIFFHESSLSHRCCIRGSCRRNECLTCIRPLAGGGPCLTCPNRPANQRPQTTKSPFLAKSTAESVWEIREFCSKMTGCKTTTASIEVAWFPSVKRLRIHRMDVPMSVFDTRSDAPIPIAMPVDPRGDARNQGVANLIAALVKFPVPSTAVIGYQAPASGLATH